jgi:hypothetical protein
MNISSAALLGGVSLLLNATSVGGGGATSTVQLDVAMASASHDWLFGLVVSLSLTAQLWLPLAGAGSGFYSAGSKDDYVFKVGGYDNISDSWI